MLSRWPGTTGPTLLAPGGMRTLWWEIRSADIVHAHGTRNAVVLTAAFFSRILNKPFILQPHGTLPHIVASICLKMIFDRLFMRSLLGLAKALIALQNAEREQIIHAGGDPGRIWVVPNGMNVNGRGYDAPLQGAFRGKYSIPENRFLLLFLGRINPKKGVDLLVKSYAKLPEELLEKSHLVIAGPDDGHLAEVRGLVAQHHLSEHVTFTGVLGTEDARAALTDSDLFVLTSRNDTFPMTIVEACAAGKPMVVGDTCEIADIISGKAATIVPVDVDAISMAVQELLLDEGLREKYRRGAKELMKNVFSIQSVGDTLELIYKGALEKNAQTSHVP